MLVRWRAGGRWTQKVKGVTTEDISIKRWNGWFQMLTGKRWKFSRISKKALPPISSSLRSCCDSLPIHGPSIGRMYFSGPMLGLPHVNCFLPAEYEQFDLSHSQAGALGTLQVLAWCGLVLASGLPNRRTVCPRQELFHQPHARIRWCMEQS